MEIHVDSALCKQYGRCAARAPEVFRLIDDEVLDYDAHPAAELLNSVLMAADVCPMQAIEVRDR